MQRNAWHNLDAYGRIAPTLSSSRAQQHALTMPDEPITASHAAQLQPTVLSHQATALDSLRTSTQPAASSQRQLE
eukprot:580791-Amphidinium_carterae.1